MTAPRHGQTCEDCVHLVSTINTAATCRGTKHLANVMVFSYYLGNLSCSNSTGNNTFTLPVGSSVSCEGSYTARQEDIEGRNSIYITAYGTSPDLPPGQQMVWSTPVFASAVWDPRFALDIIAGNCTHARKSPTHLGRGCMSTMGWQGALSILECPQAEARANICMLAEIRLCCPLTVPKIAMQWSLLTTSLAACSL